RQLVLIARALAQEPALLVMDEPTASLDFGNQIRVLEQIEALSAQGMAMLLSTHQPEHGLRVASRIALLGHGRLLGVGEPRAVA
ncbi:ABC transporter ATP-binding protein, partial [Acinetobacter baumannii]